MGGAPCGVGPGIYLTAVGLTGLCQLVWGAGIPNLQSDAFTGPPARVAGFLLLLSAVSMLAGRLLRPAGALMVGYWGLTLAAIMMSGAFVTLIDWVPIMEVVSFLGTSIWLWGVAAWKPLGTGQRYARLVFGSTLVVFGAVHLVHHTIVASLIPDWMPAPAVWPWFTGSVNIAAGLMILAGRGSRYGALAIASMYLSWLLIVHAERVAGAPGSLFEWTFALIALALAGIALTLANVGRQPIRAVE